MNSEKNFISEIKEYIKKEYDLDFEYFIDNGIEYEKEGITYSIKDISKDTNEKTIRVEARDEDSVTYGDLEYTGYEIIDDVVKNDWKLV